MAPDEQTDSPPPEELMGATVVGDDDPAIGATFSGCKVERKLGQGGMGSVYLARRASDDTSVVVKFLAPEQAKNPTWRGRFVREAETMRLVSHPNIVAVHSIEASGDHPHIVMEYVDGKGLDAVIRPAPMKPLEAARVIRDAALGLAAAHAKGVIHRDIKPANILLDRQGRPKILDFGLAKDVACDDGLSLPGQVLGTPHYMAPEQWGDHKVDARCDLFSLGVTLYQLVTRTLPFPGSSPQVISRKVAEGRFAAPRQLVPEIPEDLELAIFRMLDLDRRYRYQTAEQCAEDLGRVIAGQPVDAPRLVEKSTGRRRALLPGASFTLGRDEACELVLDDRSVSRQHARIERTGTGFMLHDLGSTYGSFVGGMKVKDVVLKDQDEVKLGKVAFEFRDGGLAKQTTATRRLDLSGRARVVPVPFGWALADAADRRSVVGLLEQLAPDAVPGQVGEARATLRDLLGGEIAEAVGAKLEAKLSRLQSRIPQFLFSVTHENLGDDVEGWLSWWDNARSAFPAQAIPAVAIPRAVLKITRGEAAPRQVELDAGSQTFSIGRDEKSRIALQSPSVSRLHATLVRLHRRLVLRDEGSRFGSVVNGRAARYAFLCPGDRIVLGKVELVFEVDPPAPAPEGAPVAVSPEAFEALEELKHPCVAEGLVRILEAAASEGWVEAEAAKLHDDPARSKDLARKVRATYGQRAERARALLPTLLGPSAEGTAAAWRARLEERRASLPPQVVPEGFAPAPADARRAEPPGPDASGKTPHPTEPTPLP